ncbi:TPA: type 1 fimbrial protein [Morganella morganii subsp. morganii]|uniref:Pilus assembly protein FimA n=1 Tax=Morganella morganii TaxID=582 RepID=A0AAU8ZLK6_MORMO|nr:fimbrial protein [Morganella morganii]HDU8691310.1 type 1 fimbrial protein [Morganella morganii subsp. morganii]AWC93758.1 pilus assembly protein FimA [Morganella morganii]EKW8486129.1 type 1 fimbrial protein [Morganella morganii]HAT3625430.1 type 1 fimbrial protein [Morganella morganii]HCU0877877.1 type 1 fimbrial protein [Morganella morganii]
MKAGIFSTGLLAICLTAYAAEDKQQIGQVWLQGFVLDSSCTINMQDKYQRIEIPQIAATALYQRGYSSAFAFSVRLENCLLSEDDKNLRITFTGPSDSNGLFAVSGEAEGVGIQLSREDGSVIIPGKVVALPDIPQTKTITLNYRLRLIADRNSLKTGAYRSTVNFNLDYL